jgi:long-chain acyl-CoA synthetase
MFFRIRIYYLLLLWLKGEIRALPAVVFLTGGTGFVGTHIARQLIEQTDFRLIVLVRGENRENAILRLKRAWWEWPELSQCIGNRIEVIVGDLSKPAFVLGKDDYRKLVQNVTHIIHAAANTTPNASYEALHSINVLGTENIIAFAKEIERDHGLDRLSHISTAYVAGKRKGSIYESTLSSESGFSSIYEKTKYESEMLVDNAKDELPVSVFRLGLVIGDSKTGAAKTFNTIYYLLRQYFFGKLLFIPTSSDFKLNVVPVDYVAEAVSKLTFDERAVGLTFHLTPPMERAPTAGQLVRFVRAWAKETMKLDLSQVLFIPAANKVIQCSLQLKSMLKLSDKKTSDAFKILSPYFSQNQEFRRENTDRLLGEYNYNWQEILPTILQYSVYYSFFHRSERTVHEQILFRLQSNFKPISYHEITKECIINYDGQTVRNEMFSVAAAMKTMGIRKGDVVAVVGFNNLRYLIIDVAIGLLGAVSSPFYYTSPVSEINRLLVETKAKLLFVGTPKILQETDKIETDIPIISFCSQSSNLQIPNWVLSWLDFLNKAKNNVVSSFAPVEFSDLATIRYTYGSTGEPKGACLDHGNLRFVAEALASNFPWKTRTTKAAYLSFLPMNHVAEGITATYSPYFVPAALDIYYLEDFHNLPYALIKAKPNVFFAIPRFYEKLWENLSLNPLGQQYLNTNNSLKKQLLRKILHFSVLRKSGLNKCAQLIVGAACTSETLLKDFQSLGIEIHNAYGLSEAPLVAMNQLDKNVIGTVGTPLLNTELRIALDGEILIRGPQVMRGYLNREEVQPFKDGWLSTGDIGEITREGYLKILGRKKNLIITSYGKKISIERIEASLKRIESVKEAIVIGNNRPYCSAIFWIGEQKDNDTAKKIEKAIEKLNKELERPAQIKRYVLLTEDPFPEQKNTETHLKIKRQDLLKQTEKIIEVIYNPAISNDITVYDKSNYS